MVNKYSQKHNKNLLNKACERYQNLSQRRKRKKDQADMKIFLKKNNKKCQYLCEHNKNLSED